MEDFLSQLSLFKGFNREKLSKLISQSKIENYSRGETIIEYGQPGRFLGILVEGMAEAVIYEPQMQKRTLGYIKSGDFFGEMSLMTGEPTSAYIIAVEDSRVLLIPQEVFTTYLVTNPDSVRVISKTITERIKNREEDKDAQERIKDAWRKHPDPYGLSLRTTMPMKLLVVNCGSSSLKYNLFDTHNPENNARGIIERIGEDKTRHRYFSKKGEIELELGKGDHKAAFESMVSVITDKEKGVLQNLAEVDAIGHRVVHGGDKYHQPVVVSEKVLGEIDGLSHLAPLHNPLNLMGIKECMGIFPRARQVAVFDTAFHHKIPIQAHLYGLPFEFYTEHKIKRYGFHGLSHHYVALKTAEFLKKPFSELKLISCHLGNGASVCAIDHGHSVDTSMGLTPTEGLIMGTRCGDLDPSLVLYLQKNLGLSIDEVDDLLNRKSGLKGISGISNDLREIESAAEDGDRRALLAIQLFCYRVKKYIGAYSASMGGVDAIIFTGGIGEGSTGVRARVCQGLGYMGIFIDELKNREACRRRGEIVDISDEDSMVRVLIVPTDEERMIARETIYTLGFQDIADCAKNWKQKPIPIEVSAHHVHLCREDLNKLFGEGYELTFRSWLSQPGQFACNEVVDLIGPKGKVQGVRILGPLRKESQVEISMTEGFKLGIDAPIRPSGELERTPGIMLEGPKGKASLSKGVICSLRHIHMAPEDALFFGLRDKDMVQLRVEGERSLIFGDVLIRVNPEFRLNMHIDTDEANAAEIRTGMIGYLEAIQERK